MSSKKLTLCSQHSILSTLLLIFVATSQGQTISLQPYAIKDGSLTVSGLSAGGAMATQFHVAFSADVAGVGIFAGVPYGCARGSLSGALDCIASPELTDVDQLFARTTAHEREATIAPTINMKRDKVYIFHGSKDTRVDPANGELIVGYYSNYLNSPGLDIKTEFNLAAVHGQPTDDFGTECDIVNSEYFINNCNYQGAFEMLNHLYDGMLVPEGRPANISHLFQFDQTEFFAYQQPSNVSMDKIGYVYIPRECQKNPIQIQPCKLHVIFHGCQQGSYRIGDTFVVNAGFLEPAESNGIILLFPQVVPLPEAGNPDGCYDWWGYQDEEYDTRNGDQMDGIWRMIQKLGYVPI